MEHLHWPALLGLNLSCPPLAYVHSLLLFHLTQLTEQTPGSSQGLSKEISTWAAQVGKTGIPWTPPTRHSTPSCSGARAGENCIPASEQNRASDWRNHLDSKELLLYPQSGVGNNEQLMEETHPGYLMKTLLVFASLSRLILLWKIR